MAQGCEESAAREAIEQLRQEGLQSDRRFLEGFVRARVSKGYGEARIRQELQLKGIDKDEAGECLRLYDWDELLAGVYERRYGKGGPTSPREHAARVRFLQQRGFAAA
ncbi:MAG: regulatory protein recX, partial [Proteobacteria bacterium]|nr:regulatory protein recX [Pseudomonadota bacterium]